MWKKNSFLDFKWFGKLCFVYVCMCFVCHEYQIRYLEFYRVSYLIAGGIFWVVSFISSVIIELFVFFLHMKRMKLQEGWIIPILTFKQSHASHSLLKSNSRFALQFQRFAPKTPTITSFSNVFKNVDIQCYCHNSSMHLTKMDFSIMDSTRKSCNTWIYSFLFHLSPNFLIKFNKRDHCHFHWDILREWIVENPTKGLEIKTNKI